MNEPTPSQTLLVLDNGPGSRGLVQGYFTLIMLKALMEKVGQIETDGQDDMEPGPMHSSASFKIQPAAQPPTSSPADPEQRMSRSLSSMSSLTYTVFGRPENMTSSLTSVSSTHSATPTTSRQDLHRVPQKIPRLPSNLLDGINKLRLETQCQDSCRYYPVDSYNRRFTHGSIPQSHTTTKFLHLKEPSHRHKSGTPLPMDYFDSVAGNYSGGLVAIFLGTLKMTVDECLEYYTLLLGHPESSEDGCGTDSSWSRNLDQLVKSRLSVYSAAQPLIMSTLYNIRKSLEDDGAFSFLQPTRRCPVQDYAPSTPGRAVAYPERIMGFPGFLRQLSMIGCNLPEWTLFGKSSAALAKAERRISAMSANEKMPLTSVVAPPLEHEASVPTDPGCGALDSEVHALTGTESSQTIQARAKVEKWLQKLGNDSSAAIIWKMDDGSHATKIWKLGEVNLEVDFARSCGKPASVVFQKLEACARNHLSQNKVSKKLKKCAHDLFWTRKNATREEPRHDTCKVQRKATDGVEDGKRQCVAIDPRLCGAPNWPLPKRLLPKDSPPELPKTTVELLGNPSMSELKPSSSSELEEPEPSPSELEEPEPSTSEIEEPEPLEVLDDYFQRLEDPSESNMGVSTEEILESHGEEEESGPWDSSLSTTSLECDEGDPVVRVLHMTLDALQEAYENRPRCHQSCRGCSNNDSHPRPAGSCLGDSSLSYSFLGGKSEKRKWNQGDGQDAGASSSPDPAVSNKRPRVVEPKKVVFACPFFKKDPIKHGKCYIYTLCRIGDVKQHLTRRHPQPPYCPVCLATFRTQEQRDEHSRARECQERPLNPPDGVTEAQRCELQARITRKMDDKEQWYTVFKILFPGQQLPPSPYKDANIPQDFAIFREYAYSHGPLIISRTIQEALPAVGYGPDQLQDLQRLVLQALERLFENQNFTQENANENASTHGMVPSSSSNGSRMDLGNSMPPNTPAATASIPASVAAASASALINNSTTGREGHLQTHSHPPRLRHSLGDVGRQQSGNDGFVDLGREINISDQYVTHNFGFNIMDSILPGMDEGTDDIFGGIVGPNAGHT